VRLVHCESENFKVTTAADLALAEQLLREPAEMRASGV
jgi:2-C-methyl-D-erythritol 4-phosphate cytidylyltransferase